MQKAVDLSTTTDTVLLGDYTDLLVLLCYHANLDSYNILFRPEPKKNTKNPKVWDIKAVKVALGPEICNSVLFLHAILGCDTTSHLYGIGKGASLKKFKSSLHFREKAKVFNAVSATHMDIAAAGEEVLVSLYNGKQHEQLDALRYKRFCEKVATSVSHVHPQTLPPSSAAAKYHSLHVYFQIQEWTGYDLDPLEWGWEKRDRKLMPVHTDLPPAPDELLRIIRCNCHTDCSTLRCTCQKHDVKCSPACGNCMGSGCTNADNFYFDETDDNIDNIN